MKSSHEGKKLGSEASDAGYSEKKSGSNDLMNTKKRPLDSEANKSKDAAQYSDKHKGPKHSGKDNE